MTTLIEQSAPAAVATIRDDAPREATDAYVAAHPRGSSYHRAAWLEVIAAAFGHETQYLTAEADGRVVGVLPLVFFRSRVFGRFAVSMPFVNYGGVLGDTPGYERALLERAIVEARTRGCTHLELRHCQQHFADLESKRHKVTMELGLTDTVESQWLALDRKVRNQVRKGEKSNLQPRNGGLDLLPAFYDVFSRNMRDLGTPVYGASFFAQVLTRFDRESRVFVVTHEGRPVAASIVHWHGATIEVPWASSLREFNPLCANVLLYWEMLRFAIERGFRTFDFGRSTPGENTYRFKSQWGAQPRELVWEYWLADGKALPELNPKNPKFAFAVRTWQRLPVAIATKFGPYVVRNIP